MKKIILLAASIAALVTGQAVAETNWTGGYTGLNAGWGFGNAKEHTSTVYSGSGYFASTSVPSIAANGGKTASPDGFTGGAQIGFNRQEGHIVYGLEADLGAFDTHDSVTSGAVYPCCSPTSYSITQSVDTDWLLTVRPRLGWATDNFLIYGTAGVSVTNIKYKERFHDTFANANETSSFNTVKAGWNVGAGAEYAFMPNWSLKAEYLYTDFGNVNGTSTNLTAYSGPTLSFPTNVFSHSTSLSSNLLRVGVNYHF